MFSKQAFIFFTLVTIICETHTYTPLSCVSTIKKTCEETFRQNVCSEVQTKEFNEFVAYCQTVLNSSFVHEVSKIFRIELSDWHHVTCVYILESCFRLFSFKYSPEKLKNLSLDFAALIVLNFFCILISIIIHVRSSIIKILCCLFGILFIQASFECSMEDRSQILKICLQISLTILFLIASQKF